MRAQSAIAHTIVSRPNTCKRRHIHQLLSHEPSGSCPLDSFPARVWGLLCATYHTTLKWKLNCLTLELIAKFSPRLPTVKKRITVVPRTPPEVERKWPLLLDLLCPAFFKALLTVFSYQPTFLSLQWALWFFYQHGWLGERVGAGNRLSPGDHSCDTNFTLLHSELSEPGQCPHKAQESRQARGK